MILSEVHTYVVSLPRRQDRRDHTIRMLSGFSGAVTYTSEWPDEFDGLHLQRTGLPPEVGLFSWAIESDNPWWCRPLKYGEIGCSLAHHRVWQTARADGVRYALIFEDDVLLPDDFETRLCDLVEAADAYPWDLLYLGRVPQAPDVALSPWLVRPGYSHCTYAYLLTANGIARVLDHDFPSAIIPVDEFLPAMYCDHPRTDVQERFPRCIEALAAHPPLVAQRAKDDAGSDTEDTEFVPPARVASKIVPFSRERYSNY